MSRWGFTAYFPVSACLPNDPYQMASAGASRFQAFMNHPAGPKTGRCMCKLMQSFSGRR